MADWRRYVLPVVLWVYGMAVTLTLVSIWGRAVVVDLGRPRRRWVAAIHRFASAMFLPLAGLVARAPADYWYLHRSLDKLPPPEVLYRSPGLTVTHLWRMGPLGFVHAVVMERV